MKSFDDLSFIRSSLKTPLVTWGYFLDGLEHHHMVSVVKWLVSHDHLVQDAAEGPEVHHAVVAVVFQLLRGEVGLGAADAVGLHRADWLIEVYSSTDRSRRVSRFPSRR